jgi:hypothetical protein
MSETSERMDVETVVAKRTGKKYLELGDLIEWLRRNKEVESQVAARNAIADLIEKLKEIQ